MRRFIGATGRVLITAGVLLLLFVAYQLWGTGLYEARAQNRLEDQFQEQLHQTRTLSTTTSTTDPTVATAPPTTTPAPVEPPQNGDAVGRIDIPKIGLSAYVVEGVDVGDLRKGPGHYPGTPLPGQFGNAAIAGHRTTYGAPFGDLDQLAAGDEITVQTLQGTFDYKIDLDPFAVNPNDGDVLLPVAGKATLTLTTCNPKYSAAERLIIKATNDSNAIVARLLSGDVRSIHQDGGRAPVTELGRRAGCLDVQLFHRHLRESACRERRTQHMARSGHVGTALEVQELNLHRARRISLKSRDRSPSSLSPA
jgi:sortase A